MSKVICEREQLVSIADAIRVQNGETSEMTLDEMSTAMDENNAEIEEISGLIEEISEILDGKAAAGGGGSTTEMSHVSISVNTTDMVVSYTTVDDDGSLTSVNEDVLGNYFEFDAVKGSMFSVWVQTTDNWVVESSGCELLSQRTHNGTFGIIDTESVVVIDFMNSSGGSND